MKKTKFSLSVVLFIFTLFLFGNISSAAVPICDINSIKQSADLTAGDGEITIQSCTGIGKARTVWSTEIIATATKSPTQSSQSVVSWDKTGGKNQALSDFGKMPGASQAAGDGVLLKKYDGGTLTYYPVARSTGTPTLQFPSSQAGKTWDKVRYF